MARAIEKGATYLDKLCHKFYDEPKGRGKKTNYVCRLCGGPLETYYCEERLYLVKCADCGTLALVKTVNPEVSASVTLARPTLTPPNEPRMINADKLAKRIAGHSNYHGDSILSAIYCAAEGKENNAPIRPIENPPNEWVSVNERLPEVDNSVLVHIIDTFDNRENIVITKYTIGLNLKMEWLGFEHNSFKVTHWMPLPEPPDRCSPERKE